MIDNPLVEAIAKLEAALPTLDAETIAKLEESTVLDHDMWFVLGDKATMALAMGYIDADVAMTLHSIHTDFATHTLAERVVYMQMMGQLMRAGAF